MVDETVETNNLDSLIFTVTQGFQPDLAINGLTYAPTSPTTNDSITFTVSVINNGPGASVLSYLRLLLDGTPVTPDYRVPALASGRATSIFWKMLVPTPRNHQAITHIDFANSIIETDETNNDDSMEFIVIDPPKPDP